MFGVQVDPSRSLDAPHPNAGRSAEQRKTVSKSVSALGINRDNNAHLQHCHLHLQMDCLVPVENRFEKHSIHFQQLSHRPQIQRRDQ
jgi:hypothetical protein